MANPTVAIVAAGTMGAGIGRLLKDLGCMVLTNLDGRSEATKKRAEEAGMEDASLKEICSRSDWLFSIMPPDAAHSFAMKVIAALPGVNELDKPRSTRRRLVYVDCNPLHPDSTKSIATLFSDLVEAIPFIDACIFSGPPKGEHVPRIYASTEPQYSGALEDFVALSSYGLRISPLRHKGAGIGAASALKMSVSGITTASTGLFASMILAAHHYSSAPSTSRALINELRISQPDLLQRIIDVIPPLLPKAYRYIFEMKEISAFTDEAETYRGLSKVFELVKEAHEGDTEDVEALKDFIDNAKSRGV